MILCSTHDYRKVLSTSSIIYVTGTFAKGGSKYPATQTQH